MDRPLFQNLERFGDAPAVITESGETVNYDDLLRQADRVGAALPGRCLVLVVCRNALPCLAGYLGLARAGAVLMLVHHTVAPAALAQLITSFRPTFLYRPEGDGGDYRLVPTGLTPAPLHPDLALLLTTSGTTGSRTFVRLSRRNVLANAAAIADYLGITAADRPITTLPLSYSYGLSIVNSHLRQGAALILTEASIVSPAFWALLRQERATTFGGVPFHYETLKKLRLERMDLPYLKVLTQAGGRLARERILELVAWAKSQGKRFIVMYGQTEATARIAYVPWAQAAAKAGSIGLAIPGGTLALADDQGQPITTPGTVGELIYRGPNVSLGYAASAEDLVRGDDHGGLLRTGDLATVDEDGFYFLVGRRKRFIKLFGHRLNLDELEQVLKEGGIPAAALGEDDQLSLFVPEGTGPEAVQQALAAHTSLSPRDYRLRPLARLPLGDNGKVDYGALRALVGEGG